MPSEARYVSIRYRPLVLGCIDSIQVWYAPGVPDAAPALTRSERAVAAREAARLARLASNGGKGDVATLSRGGLRKRIARRTLETVYALLDPKALLEPRDRLAACATGARVSGLDAAAPHLAQVFLVPMSSLLTSKLIEAKATTVAMPALPPDDEPAK